MPAGSRYYQRILQGQGLQSLERLERLESLERLERLESLERLQRLQSLESLERLERLQSLQILQSLESIVETSSISYDDYEYRNGDVVYCDPPYKNTHGYGIKFDTDAFWEWCRTRDYPVYVSEYQAPSDFASIWSKEKRVLLSRESLTAHSVEHLFVHKRFAGETP